MLKKERALFMKFLSEFESLREAADFLEVYPQLLYSQYAQNENISKKVAKLIEEKTGSRYKAKDLNKNIDKTRVYKKT